jgi:DNA-binding transcriptional LysR family regulator
MDEHLREDRVLRLNSILAATEAVAAGFGAGPLPCFLGDPRGLTRLEAPPIPSAECWLVVHPDLEKTPRVRAVMDFLIELFSREGARFQG